MYVSKLSLRVWRFHSMVHQRKSLLRIESEASPNTRRCKPKANLLQNLTLYHSSMYPRFLKARAWSIWPSMLTAPSRWSLQFLQYKLWYGSHSASWMSPKIALTSKSFKQTVSRMLVQWPLHRTTKKWLSECVNMCVAVFAVSLLYNGLLTTTYSSFSSYSQHLYHVF